MTYTWKRFCWALGIGLGHLKFSGHLAVRVEETKPGASGKAMSPQDLNSWNVLPIMRTACTRVNSNPHSTGWSFKMAQRCSKNFDKIIREDSQGYPAEVVEQKHKSGNKTGPEPILDSIHSIVLCLWCAMPWTYFRAYCRGTSPPTFNSDIIGHKSFLEVTVPRLSLECRQLSLHPQQPNRTYGESFSLIQWQVSLFQIGSESQVARHQLSLCGPRHSILN